MPRTKKQNEEIKEITSTKVREAGLKLFSSKGLAATSIIDIANEAGISVGLMYHYYKSKEDLYSDLIEIALRESTDALQKILEMPTTSKEKINSFAENILHDSGKGDQTSRYFLLVTQAMLGTNLPEKAKEYMKNVYESFNIMKEIVIAGQRLGEVKKGDPIMLTTLFLASINGICTYKLMMKDKFIAPETENISVLLVNKI